MLRAADMVPVQASLTEGTFDLDVAAIEQAITPRTRVVVVNSPANPTGRVYPRDRLVELAAVLEAASASNGRRIWLLSDEPYRRVRFDGIGFTSPAACYPWTLIDYSYGKVLLAPGQRLCYLALSPLIPTTERDELRAAMLPLQLALGWGFPDALMQYAAPALERVSIDLAELTRRRDRMVAELSQAGYALTVPEGTFYLWGAAPGGDAVAFAAAPAKRLRRLASLGARAPERAEEMGHGAGKWRTARRAGRSHHQVRQPAVVPDDPVAGRPRPSRRRVRALRLLPVARRHGRRAPGRSGRAAGLRGPPAVPARSGRRWHDAGRRIARGGPPLGSLPRQRHARARRRDRRRPGCLADLDARRDGVRRPTPRTTSASRRAPVSYTHLTLPTKRIV